MICQKCGSHTAGVMPHDRCDYCDRVKESARLDWVIQHPAAFRELTLWFGNVGPAKMRELIDKEMAKTETKGK